MEGIYYGRCYFVFKENYIPFSFNELCFKSIQKVSCNTQIKKYENLWQTFWSIELRIWSIEVVIYIVVRWLWAQRIIHEQILRLLSWAVQYVNEDFFFITYAKEKLTRGFVYCMSFYPLCYIAYLFMSFFLSSMLYSILGWHARDFPSPR